MKSLEEGPPINLPAREFNLLVFLMKTPGRVWSRVQIFEHVWEYHFDPETNLVDVYIGRLRRKIDDGYDKKLDPIRKAFQADGFRFSATGGPAYGWQASGFRLPTLPMSRY